MAQEQGAAGDGDEPGATDLPAGETPAAGPDQGSGAAEGSEAAESSWGHGGMVGDGRYRLTRRLGRGGMADVFAAEDVRLGRLVAVKLLRPDLAEDAVAKARFTREAQSVAGLNHHAVVAVYDSGEEEVGGTMGAVPYIVMELVNGHTIRELLMEEEPQSPERTLSIVAGVLEALAYSHQHGIVHRDIKPANVIITETGSVKVMDFGIARALHGVQNTMTQTGMVMGTPQYLSPEQALGKAVDTRSDLYAVGCLLYELLTQRPPFTGETPLSVVYQHVQDTPRLPSEVSELSPPEMDGLVMRSLAKDPDDRFQSAEEMRSLVLYAARMLQTHGSHTDGLWGTGSVTADTPAMGTPAMGQPPAAGPMGAPLLLGAPGGEPEPDASGGGPNRLRYLLIALLAVCAIGAGVLIAVSAGGDGDETPSRDDETTQEPPPDETGTPSPTEDEDDEEEPEPSTPTSPDWTPNPTPDPSWSETQDPTTDGATSEGDDSGTSDGATTEGDDGGNQGTDPADPADPTDPTDPADPTDPTDGEPSGEPGDPTEPDPADPADPTDPASPGPTTSNG